MNKDWEVWFAVVLLFGAGAVWGLAWCEGDPFVMLEAWAPRALSLASLLSGVMSAIFWVKAALVKVSVPEYLKGKEDGMYYGGLVANGADLIATYRLQSRWNGFAALAAAATMFLQVIAALIG